MATYDTIGKVEVAEITPEIIGNEALNALEAELHLARNVARDSEYTNAKEGETIKIPKYGSLSSNLKAAGEKVTMQNPSMDKVEVSLDNHYEVTFAVEDIAKTLATGKIQIDVGYIAQAIQVLGEDIEEALASLYSSMGANLGTGGTDITDAVLRSCRSGITSERAPKSSRFLFLDPDQLNVVLGLDKFVNAEKYGSKQPVQEGEFGRIYGFTVMESLFAQTSGSSPVTTHNLAFHRNAMVLATRPLARPMAKDVQVAYVEKDGIIFRILISYNADLLADQITIDCLWGVGTLREEFGIDLRS